MNNAMEHIDVIRKAMENTPKVFECDKGGVFDNYWMSTIGDIRHYINNDELFYRISASMSSGAGARDAVARIMSISIFNDVERLYTANRIYAIFMSYPDRHEKYEDISHEMAMIDGHKTDWELDELTSKNIPKLDSFENVTIKDKMPNLYNKNGHIRPNEKMFEEPTYSLYKSYLDEFLHMNNFTKEYAYKAYSEYIKWKIDDDAKKADAKKVDNHKDIDNTYGGRKDLASKFVEKYGVEITNKIVHDVDWINNIKKYHISRDSVVNNRDSIAYDVKFDRESLLDYFTHEEIVGRNNIYRGEVTKDYSLIDIMLENNSEETNGIIFDTEQNLAFVFNNNLICAFAVLGGKSPSGYKFRNIREYYGFYIKHKKDGSPISPIDFLEWESKELFIAEWLFYVDNPRYAKTTKDTSFNELVSLMTSVVQEDSLEDLERKRKEIESQKLAKDEQTRLLMDLYSDYDVPDDEQEILEDLKYENVNGSLSVYDKDLLTQHIQDYKSGKLKHVNGFNLPLQIINAPILGNYKEQREYYVYKINDNRNDYVPYLKNQDIIEPDERLIILEEIHKSIDDISFNKDYGDKYDNYELYDLIDLGTNKYNTMVKQLEFAKLNNLDKIFPDIWGNDVDVVNENCNFNNMTDEELEEFMSSDNYKEKAYEIMVERRKEVKELKEKGIDPNPKLTYTKKMQSGDIENITDEEFEKYGNNNIPNYKDVVKEANVKRLIKEALVESKEKEEEKIVLDEEDDLLDGMLGKSKVKKLVDRKSAVEQNKKKVEDMEKNEVGNPTEKSKSDKLVEMLLTNTKVMEKSMEIEEQLLRDTREIHEIVGKDLEITKDNSKELAIINKKIDRVDSKMALFSSTLTEFKKDMVEILHILKNGNYEEEEDEDIEEATKLNDEESDGFIEPSNKYLKSLAKSPDYNINTVQKMDQLPLGAEYCYEELGAEIVTRYAPYQTMKGTSTKYRIPSLKDKEPSGRTQEGGYEYSLIGDAPIYPINVVDENNKIIITYLIDDDFNPVNAVVVSNDYLGDGRGKIIFIYKNGYIVSWAKLSPDFDKAEDLEWKTMLNMSEYEYRTDNDEPPMNLMGFIDNEYANNYGEMLLSIGESNTTGTITMSTANKIFRDCFIKRDNNIVVGTGKKDTVQEVLNKEEVVEKPISATDNGFVAKNVPHIEERTKQVNSGPKYVIDIKGDTYKVIKSEVYGADAFLDEDDYECRVITLPNGTLTGASDLESNGGTFLSSEDLSNGGKPVSNVNTTVSPLLGEQETMSSLFDNYDTQENNGPKDWAITYNGFTVLISEDDTRVHETVTSFNGMISNLSQQGNKDGAMEVISLVARIYTAGLAKINSGVPLEKRNENLVRACETVLNNGGFMNNVMLFANRYDQLHPGQLNKHEEIING